MTRLATSLASLALLCGCASTCTAGCKVPKITLGMSEAQVRDICGCDEPSRYDIVDTNGVKHVEMTFGKVTASYAYQGVVTNGYPSPSTPPAEHCEDIDPTVILDNDKVTAIKTGRSCRRY